MSKYLLSIFGFFCFAAWFPSVVQGQIQGHIIDSTNGVPLAFVSVLLQPVNQGAYTDIDGYFSLPSARAGEELKCSYVGYETHTLQITEAVLKQTQLIIELTPVAVELTEAVVRPGENPADRIVKMAIRNKKENNPESNCAFQYDSYNKFAVVGLIDSLLQANPDLVSKLDTFDQRTVAFFEEQHLLFMESVAERKHIPPSHTTENVKASRISGFSDPSIVLLGTQLQSFSFYDDEVTMLDLHYLSPLHSTALNKYVFTIEDTTYIAEDTLFILSFQPKRNAKFTGMKGQIHINSNGYALQHVIAEPDEPPASFNVRIRQAYEFIDSIQWFPVQLNTNILFLNVNFGPLDLVGMGRTYIKNIQVNPELKRRDIGEVMLKIDPLAGAHTDTYWDAYRTVQLNDQELKTYHVIDSISKAEGLDQKLRWLQALLSGKVRVKKVDIDLDQVLGANSREGFRLGMGMHTNELFLRSISLGGYAAYGFKDKEVKYGADAKWTLRKISDTYFKLAYQNDVFARGDLTFQDQNSWLNDESIYQFFINQMDRVEQVQATFGTRLPGYLTVDGTVRKGRMDFDQNYQFVQQRAESITLLSSAMQFNELEFNLRWAFKERLIETRNRRISSGTNYPVFGATVQLGQSEDLSENIHWMRYVVSMKYTKSMPTMGDFSVQIHAGKVLGDAPALRLFALRGTAAQWSVSAPFSFETMQTGSIFSQEYAGIHVRHSFRELLLQIGNFKPQFILVHNMAIGKPTNVAQHRNLSQLSAENGYVESGLEIHNMIKSGFTGLGIGGFYRYGAANTGVLKEDLMMKITFSIVL